MKISPLIGALAAVIVSGSHTPEWRDAAESLQGALFYKDKLNDLELLQLTEITGFGGNGKQTTFDVTGAPLIAQVNSAGLTIHALRLKGTTDSKPAGGSVLRVADATGSVEVVLDSTEKQKFQALNGQPAPQQDTSSHTVVTSESFHYEGDPVTGALSASNAIHLVATQSSNRTATTSRTEIDCTGSSGTVVVDPAAPAGKNEIKSAEIRGPVLFTVTRHVRSGTAPEAVTVIRGSGDLLILDLLGAERTLSLAGHVHVTGDGGAYSGAANATRFTVTLNADLSPIRYDMTGEPVITTVHPPVAGGKR